MVKLLKIIFFLVVAAGLFLLTPTGRRFQARALSVINPAGTQQQALIGVKQSLNSISKTINGSAGKNLSDSQKTAIETALSDAQSSLADTQQLINQSNLATGINSLINKILPPASPVPSCAN